MRHRTGEARTQGALFPVMLDELVEPDALVRVVDAWVGSVDLGRLGFERAQAAPTGRPPYDPADLLKLYLYGYLCSVRSSRRLERECQRNVEVMWLLGRLRPDHKTIAEFRRTQAEALVSCCAAFVQFARQHRLVGGESVAIDGTKVRAVASRKSVLGKADLQRQLQAVRDRVQQYLSELDQADDQEAQQPEVHRQAVRQSLQALQAQQGQLEQQIQELRRRGTGTLVGSEPEARTMRAGAPGYNLQAAVDTASHMVVHHDVVDAGNDQQQLAPIAQAAAQVLGNPELHVLADAGYSNGQHLARLAHATQITAWVPPTRSTNKHGDGTLYPSSAFQYDPASDTYRCPAGQLLRRRGSSRRDQSLAYAAAPGSCQSCPNKPSCTTASRRTVTRSWHEADLQAAERRLKQWPQAMAVRKQTVEHVFGTLKEQILGNGRMLVRGTQAVRAELSLAVLAYNFKRLCNIVGVRWMQQALAD